MVVTGLKSLLLQCTRVFGKVISNSGKVISNSGKLITRIDIALVVCIHTR